MGSQSYVYSGSTTQVKSGDNWTVASGPFQGLPQEVLTASQSDPQCGKAHRSTFLICLHKPDEKDIVKRVAKLDTGASVNVMSPEVFSTLDMDMDRYDGLPLKSLGISNIIPRGQVKVDWHVMKKLKTYTSIFVILEESLTVDFDILLSDDTIKEVGFYKQNEEVWILK